MKLGIQLLLACSALSVATSTEILASADLILPNDTAFAYRVNHPVTPLPDSVIEKIADLDTDPEASVDDEMPIQMDLRSLSRGSVCSAVVSVAQSNELPIPFFANLIWLESSFQSHAISRAGAQGIAQFMPKTAAQFGLINPFEPIHALAVAGKHLRTLHQQFGNLGLAAAAYNAGPRRVSNWIAKKGPLPSETRNYVQKVTGRPAEDWLEPNVKSGAEADLMPAKAPCIEVAQAVKAQTELVRVSKLMGELADATATGQPIATAAAHHSMARKETVAQRAEADEPKPSRAKRRHKGKEAREIRVAHERADEVSARMSARRAEKSDVRNPGDQNPDAKNSDANSNAKNSNAKGRAKSEVRLAGRQEAKPSFKLASHEATPAFESIVAPEPAASPKADHKADHKPDNKLHHNKDAGKAALREVTARRPGHVRRIRYAVTFDRHALR